MSSRLPPVTGEWIDRSRPIDFTFEGRAYRGFAGDTPTSALWAAGVRVLGRSFKYHRPRGVLSMANHDVNAMMQDGARLNLRADVEPLEHGMALRGVNTEGGIAGDRLRILNALGGFLPVGFYYKAFHRPKALFPFWERVFRRMTGLGTLDFSAPHIRTPKRYDFCDVLVVGAGPSGLHAALAAGRAGAKVVAGGRERPHRRVARLPARQLRRRRSSMLGALERELAALPNVSVRPATLAAGYYTDHWVPLVDAKRMTKMRARAVVVAGGAFEQPAVFRNNDAPGVMLASAAQRLLYRYAVKPMDKALVLTANADGYRAALDLLAHGVADRGRGRSAARRRTDRADAAGEAGGHSGLQGTLRVRSRGRRARAWWRRPSARSAPDGKPETSAPQKFACDGLVMSVGWAPAAALLYQAGTTMRYDARVQQFVPDRLPEGVFACGRVNGVYALEARLEDGERAGTRSRAAARIRRARAALLRRAGSRVAVASLAGRRASFGQELRRLRRGPAGEGFLQRRAGRLRQHRAAEALLDGGHGSVAGQAFEHECDPHPRADPRRAAGRSRHHHLATVLPSGADVAPGGARLQRASRDAAAFAPRRARRGVDAGGRLAASGVLRRAGQAQDRDRARGSEGRARRRRSHRRGHARQDGALRARRRGVSRARVHGQVRQHEARHDALRRDAGGRRRGDRRRRGRPPVRPAFLLHHHDHGLGHGLPRAAAAERDVESARSASSTPPVPSRR